MKLDEFSNYLGLSQHLCDSQYQISRSNSVAQTTAQANTNYIRRQEIDWLAQHGCFGFYTTDAPGHYAQSVNHCRMRVSADQRIRIIDVVLFPNVLGEKLKVYL